ncbi:hypothetical protein KAF44_28495 (plasmid) [Cupriavidus necator]|nr:hypothetical protein KAF44_28495 [Cupriavidus necator]
MVDKKIGITLATLRADALFSDSLAECGRQAKIKGFDTYLTKTGSLGKNGRVIFSKLPPEQKHEIEKAIHLRMEKNLDSVSPLESFFLALDPYSRGASLSDCAKISGVKNMSIYFTKDGYLAPIGLSLYQKLSEEQQREVDASLAARRETVCTPFLDRFMAAVDLYSHGVSLKECEQRSGLKNISNYFSSKGKLMVQGEFAYRRLSDDQRRKVDASLLARVKQTMLSESVPERFVAALEPYALNKSVTECGQISGLQNASAYFFKDGSLKKDGESIYRRLPPELQQTVNEAIERRRAARTQQPVTDHASFQGGPSQPYAYEGYGKDLPWGQADAARSPPGSSFFRGLSPWEGDNRPQESGSTFADLSSLGYGVPYGSREFDPNTPQSVVGPSHPAGPEIVDVDSYTRQAASVRVAQRLADDPWLWDHDLVTYTNVLAQQLFGQPGAQWLNFVDPQQVRLLTDGTPQQQSEVLTHIAGPDSPPILFLPVNVGDRHWSLLVVNRHTAQSFHYDSAISPDDAPFVTNTAQFQRAAQVAAVLGAGAPAGMPIPQQADGYSCGDHVLGGIEALAHRVISGEYFQPDGMDLRNIRPDRQRILAVLTQAEQFGAAIAQPQPPRERRTRRTKKS